ncbi:MAG: hypothetical protein PHS71_08740 [Proteiniphilum sp.]|nr:hypothetical protein [Proteiniphilum sp.]
MKRGLNFVFFPRAMVMTDKPQESYLQVVKIIRWSSTRISPTRS